MRFKKQMFGFMDMLRFKNMTKVRRKALDNGSNEPLKTTYKVNEQAKRLHPGFMEVELIEVKRLKDNMKEFTFKRIDSDAFPYFEAGQYVSLQAKIGDSLVSRPYSIVSTPKEALENKLVLGIEKVGYFSTYLNEKAVVGDRFKMTEPTGSFVIEELREQKNLVFIAGGSGITPFMSLVRDLLDHKKDYNITLFYGAKNTNNLAYYKELKELARANNFKVIFVLEQNDLSGAETGLINVKLMSQFVDLTTASIFMCGPNSMYNSLLAEFTSLNLLEKNIHKDASCIGNLEMENPREFTLKVRMRDNVYEVKALENETLLVSMERAGLNAPNKCRAGGCGFCHAKLISGEFMVAKDRDGRREADKKFGYIHPCATYPLSDMEIDVPLAY